MKYRILFLGYWNLNDGLTHATIFPHLQILNELDQVEYLHFANTQRIEVTKQMVKPLKNLKVPFTPLYSKNLPINSVNKVYDFIYIPRTIKLLCKEHKFNLIIARGAPAGSLAYLVWKKLRIPFVVESFEPHAEYMKFSGEWKYYSLKYLFQTYWEKQQRKYAKNLITVAENYRNFLVLNGVKENKIFVAPCAVNRNFFNKDKNLKEEYRTKLNIPNSAVVGVYAGKFGGLYLRREAFKVFSLAFQQIQDFHLLLLTNEDSQWIISMFNQFDLPLDRLHIYFVKHNQVNSYLNVADFAFTLYKSNPVSKFLSPVKIAEYWACDLPILLTPNVGDEMNWIEQKKLGVVWCDGKKNEFKELLDLKDSGIVERSKDLRTLKRIKDVYEELLNPTVDDKTVTN